MKFLRRSLEGLILIASLTQNPEGKEADMQEHPQKQIYGQAELYPSKIQWIDEKPVIETSNYSIGQNILGICNTYSGVIRIREGLKGKDREKVLEHEIGHREFPMRSEAENRRKTYTEEPNMHPMVSYVG